MFSLIIYLVTILFNSFGFLLLISANIGQYILIFLWIIYSFIISTLERIWMFFVILYEDNKIIFSNEIPETLDGITSTVVDQTNYLKDAFDLIVNTVTDTIFNVIDSILEVVIFFGVCLLESALIVKSSVVLFGRALWFAVTFIPIQLPIILGVLLSEITEEIVQAINKIHDKISCIVKFFFDVPLESLIGLICGLILLHVYSNFQDGIHAIVVQIYWLVSRKCRWCFYTIYDFVTNPENRFLVQSVRNQRVQPMRIEDVHLDDELELTVEGLCVVCQERPKSVLILPCRHICLCSECCITIYNYQRNCPICRTFIFHSVTVYL